MDRFSVSHFMSLLYLESKLHSSHAFFLVYGAEAIVPIEVMVPSASSVTKSKIIDSHNHLYDVEVPEQIRHNAENKWLSYQKYISKAYNKWVRPRTLFCGWLSVKNSWTSQKCLSSKFAPKWEGPYVIRETFASDYYLISWPNSKDFLAPLMQNV